MPDTISRYNWQWPADLSDLEIEFQAIRYGGSWRPNKRVDWSGGGLFYHYKRAQQLLWPVGEDHHRWSDLMLQTILENRITSVIGARDSGKTHCMSRYALTDYFVFPEETLILISSTDLRGLQLRVWGDMKDLWQRAKEVHDWLPGNPVDSKHGIFTDDVGEDTGIRDIRKGIICIPCLGSNGEWLGMEKFYGVKQKRRRLLGDECFPAGTLIDTPLGPVPIQHIKSGDVVLSANGYAHVKTTICRTAKQLVTLKTQDGRTVTCTPEHPFFTQKGWIKALHLNQSHYILSPYETMRIVRETVSQSFENSKAMRCVHCNAPEMRTMRGSVLFQECRASYQILQSALRLEMEDEPTGISGQILYPRTSTQDWRFKNQVASRTCRTVGRDCENDARSFPGAGCATQKTSFRKTQSDWTSTCFQGRKWDRTNKAGIATSQNGSRRHLELWHQDRQMERERHSSCLQSRCCVAGFETGDRSRWGFPLDDRAQRKGQKERCLPSGAWVDSVEIQELADNGFQNTSPSARGYRVYNLEVEGHPSYSVNGLLVHNCSMMRQPYINTLANLDKGDFKGVFVGNPLGRGDPLDRFSEPECGWNAFPEPKKTTTWKNKFGGITINLVGTDSPNFDYPKEQPSRYPYMVDRQDEERVRLRYGVKSLQYASQIEGVRKAGMDLFRVLTRAICEQFGAFKLATWQGSDLVQIYALDAAFGGDRAVAGKIEFGKETTGTMIIKCFEPEEISIQIAVGKTAEEQLAEHVEKRCKVYGIPASNVFFDAGMYATLATAMSSTVGTAVSAVNFQGPATTRPMAADEYVLDKVTHARRLKRCDEAYSKFVTELWWSVRLVVESRQMREIPEQCVEEFSMREWTKVTGDRYEIESKKDMKERVGYSPDYADWLAIAIEGARRRGFKIAKMINASAEAQSHQWLEEMDKKAREFQRKGELNFKA